MNVPCEIVSDENFAMIFTLKRHKIVFQLASELHDRQSLNGWEG